MAALAGYIFPSRTNAANPFLHDHVVSDHVRRCGRGRRRPRRRRAHMVMRTDLIRGSQQQERECGLMCCGPKKI